MTTTGKCKRLVEYSSDEDNVSDENDDIRESLPLPPEIEKMYKSNCDDKKNDPSLHGGKTRSFPHERGVWATYVFVKYNPCSEFFEMIAAFQSVAKKHGIDLEIPDDFHISVSKTLKLRHHWIEPFIHSLKTHVCNIYKFKVMFQSLEVYENEERTRTFLGLKVHIGFNDLLQLTKRVDECLDEFQLPSFYDNPSFHLSCASCIGSKSEEVEMFMADLNVLFHSLINCSPYKTIWVTDICCKSGNKLFTICLK